MAGKKEKARLLKVAVARKTDSQTLMPPYFDVESTAEGAFLTLKPNSVYLYGGPDNKLLSIVVVSSAADGDGAATRRNSRNTLAHLFNFNVLLKDPIKHPKVYSEELLVPPLVKQADADPAQKIQEIIANPFAQNDFPQNS